MTNIMTSEKPVPSLLSSVFSFILMFFLVAKILIYTRFIYVLIFPGIKRELTFSYEMKPDPFEIWSFLIAIIVVFLFAFWFFLIYRELLSMLPGKDRSPWVALFMQMFPLVNTIFFYNVCFDFCVFFAETEEPQLSAISKKLSSWTTAAIGGVVLYLMVGFIDFVFDYLDPFKVDLRIVFILTKFLIAFCQIFIVINIRNGLSKLAEFVATPMASPEFA